jgi:hypothetical protein
MSKNVHSRMTSARNNNPNKLADLNDGIWHQLNQVRRYTETNNKEILEHNRFVLPMIWNRLCARQLSKSFQKVASETFERRNMGLHHYRLPEVLAHTSKSSLRPNFHTSTSVVSVFIVTGAIRWILSVRPSTFLRSSLH